MRDKQTLVYCWENQGSSDRGTCKVRVILRRIRQAPVGNTPVVVVTPIFAAPVASLSFGEFHGPVVACVKAAAVTGPPFADSPVFKAPLFILTGITGYPRQVNGTAVINTLFVVTAVKESAIFRFPGSESRTGIYAPVCNTPVCHPPFPEAPLAASSSGVSSITRSHLPSP